MASWLVRSTPDRVVLVLALLVVIALCSCARHFTPHSASLHPGVWMGTSEFNAGGNPSMD